MRKSWRDFGLITLVSLFSTTIIWLPFFLRLSSFWKIPLPTEGMATIMKNFDGLYYIVIAKSLYNSQIINSLFSFGLPAIYYAAHFPLYPLLIKLLAPILGHLWSMLFITLISSILAATTFYLLIRDFKYSKNPLWLTIIFLLFPARWLIVRSVGSPEPLFIFLVLLSIYFFKRGLSANLPAGKAGRKNYWLAGIFGALAQLTKPPGILLFIAYGAYLLWQSRKEIKNSPLTTMIYITIASLPLFLIPIALLSVFGYYHQVYNDFFAYFHSGDNIHLFWPPLQVFNASANWVGTFWLEEIIYVYLLGALGVVFLFKQKRYELALFGLIFFISTIFISHRDIARYSLPLTPLIIIAFEPLLTKKEFKIAFGVILLPIFLYAINFIAGNVTPLADWAPFL